MTAIEIVDVAPRDGFQSVGPFIPTETKVEIVRGLIDAGVKVVETGSFVSPKAVPQMADTAEVHAALADRPAGVRLMSLIANEKGARRAVDAGVTDLSFVFSASESHNQSNVRRSVQDSIDEFARVMEVLRGTPGLRMRLNVATSFDCPFEGTMEADRVADLTGRALEAGGGPGAGAVSELALCDTTGRAIPDHVGELFRTCIGRFGDGDLKWAYHGHDTFGLGVANALYAHQAGASVFDAACSGLGGCPFAPGATGNTATEDLVFTFENSGIPTGIDLATLLAVADKIAELPGAAIGGHLRGVPRGRALKDVAEAAE